MGRAKVTLKCIPKERVRAQTFKGRMSGLKKKMNEFCKKARVEAFFTIYEDKDKSQPSMTWPEDSTKACSIIRDYEAKKIEKPPKNFDLEDFFEIRKNMTQGEISKVRKDIIRIKYPTWNPNFTSLDEEHLMMFISILDTKIIACNQQISMLKSNQQGGGSNFNFGQNMIQSNSVSLVQNSNPNPNQNQLNFIQNTPHIQMIPDSNPNYWMPFNHYNQLAPYIVDHGFGGSQSHISHIDPNDVHLVANNDEILVDSTNQVGVPLDSTVQNNVATVNPFDEFVNWVNSDCKNENWTNQPNDDRDLISEYFHEEEFQNFLAHV